MYARVLAALMLILMSGGGAWADVQVAATYQSVDLYGYAAALKPGDVVQAFTSAGVPCGECQVQEAGTYGFLHVYGDDPATEQVEGAKPDEELYLKVNGALATAAGPDQPVWTQDGDRLQVDLTVAEATNPPSDGKSSGGGGGCFIATAAFGSPLAEQVEVLKRFRDRVLLRSGPGTRFVEGYYRLSPPLARHISERPELRAMSRAALWPLVWTAQAATRTDLRPWLLALLLLGGALARALRRRPQEARP